MAIDSFESKESMPSVDSVLRHISDLHRLGHVVIHHDIGPPEADPGDFAVLQPIHDGDRGGALSGAI